MASDLRPALAGSLALHLAVVVAGLIAWPSFQKPLMSAPVAVTLVANAPVPDVRPAVEAPETTAASAPEPTPEPPKEVAPPPTPAPPTPVPPAPPAPEPPKPPTLDLDKLAEKAKPKLDLNRLAKAQPKLDMNKLASRAQPLDLAKLAAQGPKGPPRVETAPQARPAVGAGKGLSADEASLFAAKLIPLWNPNCGAVGANGVVVRVNIRLTEAGTLAAAPSLVGQQPSDPVWQAAARRALSAVAQAAPFGGLRRERYGIWKDVNFNFDGRQACAGG